MNPVDYKTMMMPDFASTNQSQIADVTYKHKKEKLTIIMTEITKQKIIKICNEKIDKKGENVGLSFYAFFANKNDNPKLLMEVAEWWILKNKLDHFEKAQKIKEMVQKK